MGIRSIEGQIIQLIPYPVKVTEISKAQEKKGETERTHIQIQRMVLD